MRNRCIEVMQFQFVLGGKPGYKICVTVGLPLAQPVINVCDRQNDPQLDAQLQHQVKQGHRIRPAGYGDCQALAGSDRFIFPD